MTRPPLNLVPPGASLISPPANLGPAGLSLWNSIMSEYQICDIGGLELLRQACLTSDRVAGLSAAIDADGPTVRTKNGPKAHPALRDELHARAFICRILEKLGITLEPLKPVGRPPK